MSAGDGMHNMQVNGAVLSPVVISDKDSLGIASVFLAKPARAGLRYQYPRPIHLPTSPALPSPTG